jgi:hypothetical protein
MKKSILLTIILLLVYTLFAKQKVPAEVPDLGNGFNVSYRSPVMKGWPSFDSAQMKEIKRCGFRNIRLRFEPYGHRGKYNSSGEAPFTFKQEFWDYIDPIVEGARKEGIIVVLCMAGDAWEKLPEADIIARTTSWWKQMSKHFKDVPNSEMVFDLFVELDKNFNKLGDDFTYKVYDTVIKEIRKTNPKRTIIISWHHMSSPETKWITRSRVPSSAGQYYLQSYNLFGRWTNIGGEPQMRKTIERRNREGGEYQKELDRPLYGAAWDGPPKKTSAIDTDFARFQVDMRKKYGLGMQSYLALHHIMDMKTSTWKNEDIKKILLEIPQVPQISGHLTGQNGQPVKGTAVVLSGKYNETFISESTGRFVFYLHEGNYTVSIKYGSKKYKKKFIVTENDKYLGNFDLIRGKITGAGTADSVIGNKAPPGRKNQDAGRKKNGIAFVRVVGSDSLNFAEVQVYAEGKNIALTGKASSSTEHAPKFAAHKGNDGNINGSMGKEGIFIAKPGDKTAWWELSLKSPALIEKVVLYNRTDGKSGERTGKAKIELLDTEKNVIKTLSLSGNLKKYEFELK